MKNAVIILVLTSQVLTSCYSYRVVLKPDAQTKVIPGKEYQITFKEGRSGNLRKKEIIKATRVDNDAIYALMTVRDLSGRQLKDEHGDWITAEFLFPLDNISSIKLRQYSLGKTDIAIGLPLAFGILIWFDSVMSSNDFGNHIW